MSGQGLLGDSVRNVARSRGVTIVEVLVTVIAATLVSAIIYQMFQTASDVLSSVFGQGTIQMETTLLKSYFSRDAMMVQDFPASYLSSDGTTYTQHLSSTGDGHATLILTVSAIDAAGQNITDPVPKYDQIIYKFDRDDPAFARQARRIVYADPASSRRTDAPGGHIVARSIKDVGFSCPSDPLANTCTTGDLEVDMKVTAERREGKRSFLLDLGALGSSWSSRLANATLAQYSP